MKVLEEDEMNKKKDPAESVCPAHPRINTCHAHDLWWRWLQCLIAVRRYVCYCDHSSMAKDEKKRRQEESKSECMHLCDVRKVCTLALASHVSLCVIASFLSD